AREMEGAALNCDDSFAHERIAAIDEPRGLGAVLERDRRDVGRILLVGLREIGRVGVNLDALLVHPGDGGSGVEPAREREADFGPRGRKRSMDAAHGGRMMKVSHEGRNHGACAYPRAASKPST